MDSNEYFGHNIHDALQASYYRHESLQPNLTSDEWKEHITNCGTIIDELLKRIPDLRGAELMFNNSVLSDALEPLDYLQRLNFFADFQRTSVGEYFLTGNYDNLITTIAVCAFGMCILRQGSRMFDCLVKVDSRSIERIAYMTKTIRSIKNGTT